ncbi:hypothetical protein CBER1_11235 [Cercospora berteroae]|uniref:Methanethiol oxidase n=1 Tax=Cercospora berteroae TaxID=357750 RepID=A0A2S6CLQ8_9PEZI|nr:hypothetical protein CBER1_11235 [Cercospora berteroae]
MVQATTLSALAACVRFTFALPHIDQTPVVAAALLEYTKRENAFSPLVPRGLPASLSLPPLLPKLEALDPIYAAAPPLPILQLPTPPLTTPGYFGSDIRPRKIGYFWTAAGDNVHSDFLATFSLDDDTFGTLLRVVEIGLSGCSPHHSAVSLDGQVFWGGCLLSLLKTQDTGIYIDTSDVYNPRYWKSDRATLASIADEVVAKPGGGFFFTYMGSLLGTSPGRLVETSPEYEIIHQWPEDLDGTLNILGQQFSPHGLSIDFDRGLILTSDFVVPLTVLKPVSTTIDRVQRASTLRLWDLATRTIINTINIPDGGGIQDVKFIPGNPEGAALCTAVHPGQVWIIYPYRLDEFGKPGVAELFYQFEYRDTVAVFSTISKNGRFAYFTFTTANHIAALDITDLRYPIRLDNPYEIQPVVGAHYLKLTPDQRNLVVCDYFVQVGPIGVVNTPADYRILYIDILPNGALSFGRSIDFASIFADTYGGAKPHSVVIFDLTDPWYPQWY